MASPGVTLTVNLQDTSGQPNAGAFLRVTLCQYGQSLPRVIGTAMLAQVLQRLPLPAGTISLTLWGNYQISPAGTFYEIAVLDKSKNVVQAGMYRFDAAGTFDLSTLGQIFPSGSPYVPPDGIAVLTNPPGAAAQTIEGPLTVQGPLVYTGALNAAPTLYVVAINGGAPVFDGAKGTGQSLTLTQSLASSSAINFPSGTIIPVILKQDATGGRAVAWPGTWKSMPNINLEPNGITSFAVMQDETGAFYPVGSAVLV